MEESLKVVETNIDQFQDLEGDVHIERKQEPTEYIKNTQKILKHFAKREEKPLDMNSVWKKTIMRKVPEVSHIAFEQYERTGENYIKVVVRNASGGKDYVRFKININPNMMTSYEWETVYNSLKNKDYANQGSVQ